MMKGLSIEAIAAKASISQNTERNNVKTIFPKIGVSLQGELVALLMQYNDERSRLSRKLGFDDPALVERPLSSDTSRLGERLELAQSSRLIHVAGADDHSAESSPSPAEGSAALHHTRRYMFLHLR